MSGTPPDPPPEAPVATNLRAAFATADVTAADLAQRLSRRLGRVVHERTVRRWLRGESTPSWESLCAIAAEFGIADPGAFYAAEPTRSAA
jgi:transcriptional regulator with XRE-family HTH domain